MAMGDMLELGAVSRFEHDLIGRAAAVQGVDLLAAVGPQGRVMADAARKHGLPRGRVAWFPDSSEAAAWLSEKVKPQDYILVKGSRGMRMERIVEALSGKTA